MRDEKLRRAFAHGDKIPALTISQPFASLIANGEKWVENRTWFCRYRGPLAIHAGKGKQYLSTHELRAYPTGAVLAIAEMVACIHLELAQRGSQKYEVLEMERAGLTLDELVAHEHAEGPYCFVLRNVRRLPEPIPCRGAQGLWSFQHQAKEA